MTLVLQPRKNVQTCFKLPVFISHGVMRSVKFKLIHDHLLNTWSYSQACSRQLK